jgi:hypothetical protein
MLRGKLRGKKMVMDRHEKIGGGFRAEFEKQ